MTITETDFDKLLLTYNFVGEPINDTDPVPGITLSTDTNNNYVISYTMLQNSADVTAAGYYSSYTDITSNFATTTYKSDVETVFRNIFENNYGTHSVLFEDVAKISFEEETSGTGLIAVGQLTDDYSVFSASPNTSAFAVQYSSSDTNASDVYGDIWINTEHDTEPLIPFVGDNYWDLNSSITEGTHAFKIALEEISHSLGVDVRANHADTIYDSHKYTITSYNLMDGMDVSNDANDVLPAGLQLLDIAALQAIYGADTTTRLGDTTYKEGQGFASNVSDAFIYTIWDAGGAADTIDASSYTDGVYIDLNEGAFSSIGKAANSSFVSDRNGDGVNETGLAKDNVAIAYGAEIENATGTDANDTLIGNDLNNHLIGGWGADHLYGGAGNDTLDGGVHGDFYHFQLNGGIDTITETWSGNNKIVFDSNVNFADVTAAINGNDITYTHTDGTQMILQDYLIKTGGSASATFDTSANTGDNSQEQRILSGGSSHDTLSLNSGLLNTFSVLAFGNEGNDQVFGSNNNDVLYGGADNDDLRSYEGSDKLYGGEGDDDLAMNTQIGQTSYAYGGEGDDRYTFDFVRGDVVAEDTSGDDHYGGGIVSSGSLDLTDYSGHDIYQVNGQNITIEDAAGDDYYSITGTNYSLKDSGGNDHAFLRFESYNYDGYAQSGNDLQIFFYNYATQITFTDYFVGSIHQIETVSFFDTGTLDFDYLFNPSGYILGTNGSDTNLNGTATDDIIYGFDGNDTVNGSLGNDELYGGLHNDTLIGGAGNDILNGGDGVDTADYSSAQNGVVVSLVALSASDDGDGGADTLYNIENVIGSEFADSITGDNAGNVLDGRGGNDTLFGRDDDDTLNGGDGNDVLRGLGGNDILNGGAGNDSNLNGDAGNDTVNGDAGDDTLWGGAGNDMLNGGTGSDTIGGGSGDDAIDGGDALSVDTVTYVVASSGVNVNLQTGIAVGEGTDSLSNIENVTGSDHDDIFVGDGANNLFAGGSGVDTVDYSDVTGSGVVLSLHAGTTYDDGKGGTDTLSSIENVIGSNQADTLTGSDVDNILEGRGGNDKLYGRDGVDTLYGGDGVDVLRGHDGNDVLDGGAGNDTNLNGDGGDDTVRGGDGNDIVIGGAGNDILYGDSGADTLYGLGDADTFMFETATAFDGNLDVIADFTTGDNDALNVADLLIGYDPLTDAITDFVQITDDGTDSTLAVDVDGGADNFVNITTLQNVTGLTDEDSLENNGHLIAA